MTLEGPGPHPRARRRFPRVPRGVRRALLLTAWILATTLLAAEIVVSIRHLLA